MFDDLILRTNNDVMLSVPTPNNAISFFHNGTLMGTLDFNGPEMTFSGQADESAKIFFDVVAKLFRERFTTEVDAPSRLL